MFIPGQSLKGPEDQGLRGSRLFGRIAYSLNV